MPTGAGSITVSAEFLSVESHASIEILGGGGADTLRDGNDATRVHWRGSSTGYSAHGYARFPAVEFPRRTYFNYEFESYFEPRVPGPAVAFSYRAKQDAGPPDTIFNDINVWLLGSDPLQEFLLRREDGGFTFAWANYQTLRDSGRRRGVTWLNSILTSGANCRFNVANPYIETSISELSMTISWDGVFPLGAPPLRQFPRDDGLATSSAPRLYPRPRSVQAGFRKAGGTYL